MTASQDNIIHYTSVRMRIVGSGQLDMTMYSQDDVHSQPLVPFTMQATMSIRPNRLMNFQHQKAMLQGSVNVLNEWFRINKIVIYAKEVFADYPDGGA